MHAARILLLVAAVGLVPLATAVTDTPETAAGYEDACLSAHPSAGNATVDAAKNVTLAHPCLVPVPGILLNATNEDFERIYLLRMHVYNQASRAVTELARENAANPELRAAAANVTEKQEAEGENLTGLLEAHHNVTAPTWNETRMGEAMDARIDILRNLSGRAFDEAYVNTTIEHKLIAIHMSDFAVDRAAHDDVQEFAEEASEAKRADVEKLRDLRESPAATPTAGGGEPGAGATLATPAASVFLVAGGLLGAAALSGRRRARRP